MCVRVCVCEEGASINTPMRGTRHVPIRDAHGKLSCDSLLQGTECSLSFLSFSPYTLHVLPYPPPLTPTPPTHHQNMSMMSLVGL